jgi:hypothetical protein
MPAVSSVPASRLVSSTGAANCGSAVVTPAIAWKFLSFAICTPSITESEIFEVNSRIAQVEPVLQKINAQHNRQADRLAAVASLGIIRRDQGFQLGPWNYCLHGAEKLLPTARP